MPRRAGATPPCSGTSDGTARGRCGRARPVHRRNVVLDREPQEAREPAAAPERAALDHQPACGAFLGTAGRRHHPEHERIDLHRGEHPAVAADHLEGCARHDPGRRCRRDGPRHDRHLRYQDARALCRRDRGCRGGHREALKISGHRGVIPRRGHGHPRPGACQGGCGAACRRALVPGLDAGNRELNGSCLFRRGPADVHRAVLWRGLRLSGSAWRRSISSPSTRPS